MFDQKLPYDQYQALLANTSANFSNPFATINDLIASGVPMLIVTNYSALPPAASVTGKYYRTANSEGSSWRPTWLGGSYYPKGIYYSNGSTWEFVGEFPYQATQSEVNAGTNDTNYVTPFTLKNAKLRKHYGNLSQSAINALTDMVIGDSVFNTTYQRTDEYKDFWGWHPLGTITPDWGISFWDEAVNTSPSNYFSASTANGGTATAQYLPLLAPQTKLWGITTGTATNGESRHLTNNYFIGSVGKKEYEVKLCPSVVSDGTNRYVLRAGYLNLNGGLTLSPGMYFLYDEGGVYGTSTASPNWLCVCNTATGLTTVVNSGVPVKVQISNSMQKLRILDYGTGNKVEFYIDNILVATITTNIPTSSIDLYIGEVLTKQAGTTNRNVYIDYSSAKEKFNTPR